MNPKIALALKAALVVFIGMCIVILSSVNKITSSILLTITVVIILLPIKLEWLRWCRAALVLIVFALVIWNISTTDYPRDYYNTGFKFFDQVLHIFDGFLRNVFGTRLDV